MSVIYVCDRCREPQGDAALTPPVKIFGNYNVNPGYKNWLCAQCFGEFRRLVEGWLGGWSIQQCAQKEAEHQEIEAL